MSSRYRSSPIRIEGISQVNDEIVLFGTSWCGMTQMVRRYLDRSRIQYRYHDLDDDPEAVRQLKWLTGGYTSHPTVVIDGQILIEPDMDELEFGLERGGYI